MKRKNFFPGIFPRCISLCCIYCLLSFAGCAPALHIVNDDFLIDLSSENSRIDGELSLDEFNSDLSSLEYEYYVDYLRRTEMPSASGLCTKIGSADGYYFKSYKNYFIVALFYENDQIAIVDNSNTFGPDTVINNKTSFSLGEFVTYCSRLYEE